MQDSLSAVTERTSTGGAGNLSAGGPDRLLPGWLADATVWTLHRVLFKPSA
jgi:hypothetical protein